MTTATETKTDAINEFLQRASDFAEEYNTCHGDAGSEYAHLPKESALHLRQDVQDRFREYCVENGIGLPHALTESVLQELYDRVEMLPGSIFGRFSPDAKCIDKAYLPDSDAYFNLDSYAVQEIEEEIELSSISKETGIERPELDEILEDMAKTGREHCLRYNDWKEHFERNHPGEPIPGRKNDDCAYLYIATDAVWFACVSDEAIQETITREIIAHCERVDSK